jgi:hypothetical protein
MSELLPSVAKLAEKVEGRKALYFVAAAAAFVTFAVFLYNNRDEVKNVPAK